jgi:hypothetical protein
MAAIDILTAVVVGKSVVITTNFGIIRIGRAAANYWTAILGTYTVGQPTPHYAKVTLNDTTIDVGRTLDFTFRGVRRTFSVSAFELK